LLYIVNLVKLLFSFLNFVLPFMVNKDDYKSLLLTRPRPKVIDKAM